MSGTQSDRSLNSVHLCSEVALLLSRTTTNSCLSKVGCIDYHYNLPKSEISLNKRKISDLIMSYFENEIKDLVPLKNYVIDFCVDPITGYIKVIELNPWCDAASASLFNWNDPVERVCIGMQTFTKPGSIRGKTSVSIPYFRHPKARCI